MTTLLAANFESRAGGNGVLALQSGIGFYFRNARHFGGVARSTRSSAVRGGE